MIYHHLAWKDLPYVHEEDPMLPSDDDPDFVFDIDNYSEDEDHFSGEETDISSNHTSDDD